MVGDGNSSRAGPIPHTHTGESTKIEPFPFGMTRTTTAESAITSPAVDPLAHRRLVDAVRQNPASAKAHRELADYFRASYDLPRCRLMDEIADALDGKLDPDLPAPNLISTSADRGALRPLGLSGDVGDFFALCGDELCQVMLGELSSGGPLEKFELDGGPGAKPINLALLCAIRTLGICPPDVLVSADEHPPVNLAYLRGPKILIGRAALEEPPPDPQLRFFAARALIGQSPDLLALRLLPREKLKEGLAALKGGLFGGRHTWASRQLREAFAPSTQARLRELFPKVGERADLDLVIDDARRTADRAGLLVAGGIGPSLAALASKGSTSSEIHDVTRFAASEAYLKMRLRCFD